MKRLFAIRNLAVLLCTLLAGFALRAQNVGSLQGQVTDPGGAFVIGAKVSATDASTGITRTTQTDSSGEYIFSQLSPGTYKLEVVMNGFRGFVASKVSVVVATTTSLDVRLELGSVSERVMVESAAPTLNTEDASVGNAFAEDQVKSLPFLARNVVNLLTLQPGVVFTGRSDTDRLSMGSIATLDLREGVVNGIRGNQNSVTVDGVDSNDWQNQAAFTSALPVTLDSVQEFRVTTTNANATNGLVGGAQVQLVTKSGSNEFHGNARWYYRTSGATANSFFNKAQDPEIGRPKLQRNIGGGSIGGPIKKDRLFLFLDYETRREASSFSVVPREVPSDTLKAGVLVYECADPSQCPGGTVTGLNGKTFTVPQGTFGLTPAQFQSIDSAGIGVNPAMISYMSQLPSGNAPVQGLDNLAGQPLAFNGLIFNAPEATSNNVYTARMDYNITRDGHQAVYVRGVLGGLKTDLIEANFPGEAPTSTLLNNSRGIAVSYTYQIR